MVVFYSTHLNMVLGEIVAALEKKLRTARTRGAHKRSCLLRIRLVGDARERAVVQANAPHLPNSELLFLKRAPGMCEPQATKPGVITDGASSPFFFSGDSRWKAGKEG